MNPEPDAIAIDLICRLTKAYSERLWSYNRHECISICSSCKNTRRLGDSAVHNDGCEGVKLIIEALNYSVTGKSEIPIELILNITSGYYYALLDLENNDRIVGEEPYNKIIELQNWLKKYVD